MFLQNFIDEQKRLLVLEQREEVNQSKIISESSPKILEEKNLCIRKLKIANIFTGLYGRTILEFEWKQNREESSKRVFSQGDIIAVCKDSGKNDVTKPIATGLFYKLTKEFIQIALDNDLEDNVELQDVHGIDFRLVKLSSEVTYQRLKAGLKYLEKRTNPLCGDYLIDLLMGDGQLRMPNPIREITYFNDKLNESQKDAIKFAIARPDIAIVHGPPGTGKTTVAVEIISQILDQISGHKIPKILVCTPSNIALDNLAEKLLKVSFVAKNEKQKSKKSINVLRLGHSARVMPHLSDISLDHKLSVCDQAELILQVRSQIDWTLKQSLKINGKRLDKRRELSDLRKELCERELKAVREVLGSSQVIMSTLTGLRSNKFLPLNEIEFDVVIIDEVSQAIEAACWLAIPRGKKLILAGDHKQLPPTVLSDEAVKAGLGRSLMERLLEMFPPLEITRMLTCQYRMHKDIMQWSSDTFYNSDLVADSSVAGHVLADICTDNDQELGPLDPLVFLDTAGTDLWELDGCQEDSKGNLGEAHLAAVYIKELVDRFNVSANQIGVITPYSRQVQLVKQCLRDKVQFRSEFEVTDIEVSTVDGFQGREKEVIVTTLVRSNHSGTVGFLSEIRRLNVALTRAKRHLCVIGDSSTIVRSGNKTLCSLVEYWQRVADVHSGHQYIYENDIVAGDCILPTNKTKKTKKDMSNKQRFEDKDIEKKVCDEIKKFSTCDKETILEFSTDLSPRVRAILHELAELLGLRHVSVGDGNCRKLIVSKIPKVATVPTKEKTLLIDTVESNNEFILTRNCQVEKEEKKVSIIAREEELKTLDIDKEVKKLNIIALEEEFLKLDIEKEEREIVIISMKENREMKEFVKREEIYPSISKTEVMNISEFLEQNFKNSETKITEKPTKSKKTKPKKLESRFDELSDDFDSVLEQFQQLDKVCQHPGGCKALVSVLGFNCRYCKKRFCSGHTQPEVHQCRDVTMSVWRSESEAPRPVSKKQALKHSQLSREMAKKIDAMKSDRTGASKDKKK